MSEQPDPDGADAAEKDAATSGPSAAPPLPDILRPGIEPASPDVAAADSAALPGAHRGGFSRLPTAPVDVMTQSAPGEPGAGFEPTTAWVAEPPRRVFAGTALAFALAGLAASFFVGWGFPIGAVAVVLAVISLRRPQERRAVAAWALAIGILSLAYSVGWLVWAAVSASLY